VIVEIQQPLIRLLQQLPDVAEWILWGQPLPAFDVHCPLLTLPLVFDTTLKNIPPQRPPLRPDPALYEAWEHRLAPPGASRPAPPLRVGLIWSGSPKNLNDSNRSVSLSLFAALATLSGIEFYSVQKGPAGAQAAHPPKGMQLIDHTDQLHDFADTAAMISHLDLIITVDTSVAHLAGAMGKPVWVLISFLPDWRWLQARDDSPWYPTMRLFRQIAPGNWHDVIARVVNALAQLRGT
jgi:hypothetical protein